MIIDYDIISCIISRNKKKQGKILSCFGDNRNIFHLWMAGKHIFILSIGSNFRLPQPLVFIDIVLKSIGFSVADLNS